MKTLNLLHTPHADFVVERRIGPIISWHGRTIDLRQISEKDAEAIASDKHCNALRYSDARVAADTKAAQPAKAKRDEKA